MKHFYALCLLLTGLLNVNIVYCQCNITTCNAFFSVDDVDFNVANNALEINNVQFGNIACSNPNAQIGLDVYIYQILPNGSRSDNCNVLRAFPNNFTGYVNLDLGKDPLCGYDYTLQTLTIGESDGFYACDGALYEVELALYITNNSTFLNSGLAVSSSLSNNEYILLSAGFVETHISNTFPGNGQPLLINEIKEWHTGTAGTIEVACYQDVELYIQGQSMLSNCGDLTNYNKAIPSETSNILLYSIDFGAPQDLLDVNITYNGGQQTGSENNGFCYGGIFTNNSPFVFDADLVPDACDGHFAVLTLFTHDGFTNELHQSTLKIIYSGEECPDILTVNDTPILANTYKANQNISSNGMVNTFDTVIMEAGSRVTLNRGFKARAGSRFNANIQPCQ